MLSANISTTQRRAIYRRDGYRCALCDSTRQLQIHHYIPRSKGGSNHEHNLICLCALCHAIAHGINYPQIPLTKLDIDQAIVEYLADLYTDGPRYVWNPWEQPKKNR